jgi:hypothetical protein
MYVDNELTGGQRTAVELFVQQNPDLQKEFELLQQTKLIAEDEIMFAHKTDLLKIKDSIGIDNYEEFFLLYVDNELNESGNDTVEKFVLQQPRLQDEFTLLKQTVLQPEKIVFPDKKTLYRREERRVVPYWTRIAAAAAFIGIAALVWWITPHVNNINGRAVATVQPKKQTVKPAQSEIKKQDQPVQPVTQPSTNTSNQLIATEQTKNKKDDKAIVKTEKRSIVKPVEKNIQDVNNDIALSNKKKKDVSNALPQVTIPEKKDDAVVKNEPVISDINTENDNPNEDPLQKAKSINAMNDPNVNVLVHPAVYKELNTNDDDLQNTLYVGNMGLNKNKVRGIMKKVGGLFARKSKNSSDEKGKLQVANFELNTN